MLRRLTRAERLFTRGQRLVAQDKIAEALPVFEQGLALQPRATGVYLHRALALSEAARLSDAVEAMHQAMALQPSSAVFPLFLGQIFFDHADYANAKAWGERALALNPHQYGSHALLALIEMARGHIPSGYQRLQQPLALSLSFVERLVLQSGVFRLPALYQQISSAWQGRLLLVAETYLLHHQGEAQTLVQQLIPASPEAQARRQVPLADQLLTRGVMCLRRLASHLRYARQPTRRAVRLLYIQAEEAYYLGQLPEAAKLYGQIMERLPQRQLIQQRLCEIAYEQGDFGCALKHLQHLIGQSAQPSAPDAWDALLLGELQYQVGEYEHTAASLAQAVSLQRHEYRVAYYLGLCRLRAGAPHEARRYFTQAIRLLHPDIVALRLDEMYRVSQWVEDQGKPPQAVIDHPAGIGVESASA